MTPNQGVIVDNDWVAELIEILWDHAHEDAALFPVSRSFVWDRVQKSCVRLGIDFSFWRLHRLRHTGAATDVYLDRRSLEQARRRGRWAVLSSVERYTKSAQIAADLADLTKLQLQKGREFLTDPRRFIRIPAALRVVFA